MPEGFIGISTLVRRYWRSCFKGFRTQWLREQAGCSVNQQKRNNAWWLDSFLISPEWQLPPNYLNPSTGGWQGPLRAEPCTKVPLKAGCLVCEKTTNSATLEGLRHLKSFVYLFIMYLLIPTLDQSPKVYCYF